MTIKLRDLAVEHPYYASDSNFFSNEAGMTHATMTDFLDEFEDADVDMNQVFRFDVFPARDKYDVPQDTYSAQIIIIHQRKGIYSPHTIKSIKEGEVERFVKYLTEQHNNMKMLWRPFGV